MLQRRALAIAGAITAAAAAAVIGIGANAGLLGVANQEHPGQFRLVEASQSSQVAPTQVVDVPVPVEVSASSGAPTPPASSSRRASPSTATTPGGDGVSTVVQTPHETDPGGADDGASPQPSQPQDD